MNKKKVLIIDDDPHIREILDDYLNFEGFDAFLAEDTEKGLKILQEEIIDILILDIMLPDEDGWEFCQKIRPEYDLPIIFLSAKDKSVDKITGLELGADDYITKPFSPREVVARIKAVLRRYNKGAEAEKTIKYGELVINREQHLISFKGEKIDLTPKEFSLLWHLAENPKKVFRRERLLKAVWGYDYYGDVRTVDTHIKSLRKKLGEEAAEAVETVWGVGYKFDNQKLEEQ
ncbi:response regulator transcription factor [Halanaerobium sp. Z-7514]|uniref:Stage 0 sporulation protein A homolog n=1 Tax=Halanaerobium polyolivorans TaxID=2886943 RepID=A0AAW4X0C6_9FIRM|nr:response regulator transcription factor [Halanaerobium polyolivorans]MCC3145241.1 response regulator transcription factor [Halanaerobium polyolivorans]RQD74347.1 MAG: DNA-binding response regulator [Halanaerobium sp. MSAO_Bac5]